MTLNNELKLTIQPHYTFPMAFENELINKERKSYSMCPTAF